MGAAAVPLLVTSAIATTGAAVYSASEQNQSLRRAETRAKSLFADQEKARAEAKGLIDAQNQKVSDQIRSQFSLYNGRKMGRNSLIYGSEMGVSKDKPNIGKLGTNSLLGSQS